MKRNAKTMNPYLLALPVLAIGLQDSASACVSPAIASICADFPEISTSIIQLMVTLPSLAVCVVAPIYGWLSTRVQPRKLVIAGLLMFIIGGLLPAFINDIYIILACRLLLGVGAGLTLPACDSIIPALYEGQMRENMMGWNMTVGAIGCMLMIFIGGQLAVIDWHLSFLGYSIGIITLLLVLFLLPEIPMVSLNEQKPRTSDVFKGAQKSAWLEIFVYFIGVIFMTMVTSNISIFIESEGIGTAANSGASLSLHLFGAALGAFAYGFLKKHLKYYVIPLAWLLLGAGFFLVVISKSIGSIYASMVFAGLGVGIIWPAYCMRMVELSEPVSRAMTVAIAGAAQGLGTFLNPIVGGWCVLLLGINYGKDLIFVPAVVLTCGAVLITIVRAVTSRSKLLA